MTIGGYHTAARGQSKKLQLMNVINDCMRHVSNRDEFIALMESEGYKEYAGRSPGATSPTPHPAAGSAVTACCSVTNI